MTYIYIYIELVVYILLYCKSIYIILQEAYICLKKGGLYVFDEAYVFDVRYLELLIIISASL